jgi:hypothetical protein
LTKCCCAHCRRHYGFLGRLAASPSKTCIHTDKDSPYSTFTGKSAYFSQVTNYPGYYNTTGPSPLAWYNWDDCGAANLALCEVPAAAYTCPPAPLPPPAAPIPPACESTNADARAAPGPETAPSSQQQRHCHATPGPHRCPAGGCAAGTPPNNATHYCAGASCYLLNATADTYQNHKAACALLTAWPVAYNNASEQQEVEAALDSQAAYWLGVEQGSQFRWLLADGSGSAGNGLPSNAAPYAHWWVPGARARCLAGQQARPGVVGRGPRAAPGWGAALRPPASSDRWLAAAAAAAAAATAAAAAAGWHWVRRCAPTPPACLLQEPRLPCLPDLTDARHHLRAGPGAGCQQLGLQHIPW